MCTTNLVMFDHNAMAAQTLFLRHGIHAAGVTSKSIQRHLGCFPIIQIHGNSDSLAYNEFPCQSPSNSRSRVNPKQVSTRSLHNHESSYYGSQIETRSRNLGDIIYLIPTHWKACPNRTLSGKYATRDANLNLLD